MIKHTSNVIHTVIPRQHIPERQSGCCSSWSLYWPPGTGELVHSYPESQRDFCIWLQVLSVTVFDFDKNYIQIHSQANECTYSRKHSIARTHNTEILMELLKVSFSKVLIGLFISADTMQYINYSFITVGSIKNNWLFVNHCRYYGSIVPNTKRMMLVQQWCNLMMQHSCAALKLYSNKLSQSFFCPYNPVPVSVKMHLRCINQTYSFIHNHLISSVA